MAFASIFRGVLRINKALNLKSNSKSNHSIFFDFLLRASFFSSSSSPSSDNNGGSKIPAMLRHKDWLTPPEILQIFASLEKADEIVPELDHYSRRKDYKPNEALFSLILRRLAEARLFSDADAVFRRVTSERQCRLSDEFFRCAIGVFDAEKAVEILLDMPRKYECWPSTETFNSALNILVSAKMFRAVGEVFVAAPRLGVAVDSESLNAMVRALCESGKMEAALQVLDEFPKLKFEPSSSTFVPVLRGFCAEGRSSEAFGLIERMEKEGIEADVVVYNAMIGGFVSHGSVDDALGVFDRMRIEGCDPDSETYGDLLSGMFESRRVSEAVEIAKRAIGTGVALDFEAYEGLISGLCCEDWDRTEDVCWVLKEMIREGFAPNVGVWSVILERLFRGKTSHFCGDACEDIMPT